MAVSDTLIPLGAGVSALPYPVTDREYREYVPTRPETDDVCVQVTAYDAEAYAAWRSYQDGRTYRLPTDEEYEALVATGQGYLVTGPYWYWTATSDAKDLSHRVVRGGSFRSLDYGVRAAYRDFDSPDLRVDDIGFRLVVEG